VRGGVSKIRTIYRIACKLNFFTHHPGDLKLTPQKQIALSEQQNDNQTAPYLHALFLTLSQHHNHPKHDLTSISVSIVLDISLLSQLDLQYQKCSQPSDRCGVHCAEGTVWQLNQTVP
jgi:hypothetical protein